MIWLWLLVPASVVMWAVWYAPLMISELDPTGEETE